MMNTTSNKYFHRMPKVSRIWSAVTFVHPVLIMLGSLISLTGCISNYSYFYDEMELPTASHTEMCRYSWAVKEPHYRYHGLNVFPWGQANYYGIENTLQAVHQQISNCPSAVSSRNESAIAETYYLRYVDTFDRQLFMIPDLAVFVLSAGILPLRLTDYYAVCITITDNHGRRRTALSKGHLNVSRNMWEMVFPSEKAGARRNLKKEAVLWGDLTEQAWKILWMPDHPSNRLPGECRDILDSMTY